MRKLTMLLLWAVWLGCSADGTKPPEGTPRDSGDGNPAVVECAAAEAPTCCEGWCSDVLVRPVCTHGSWSCPEGSRDARQCPSSPGQPACWGPSHPQTTYTYPGCANEDYHCPRLKTAYCALESIRSEHAACEQDSDCVAATLDGECTGSGQCPPPMVNASGRADFESRAAAEVARYCTGSPLCVSSGSCAYPSFVPRCKEGRCVAEPSDAGTPAP